MCEKQLSQRLPPRELSLACFLTGLRWPIHSTQAELVGLNRVLEGESFHFFGPSRSLEFSS